jgi:hypothetical protein
VGALLIAGLAGVMAFAAMEPPALKAVEAAINDRFRSGLNDPFDLLGTARGSYLPGYGAVFTVELNLVTLPPLAFSPFSQAVTPQEVAALHDRKVKKLSALRDAMHDLMLTAGSTLTTLGGDERVTMEAFLFNYRWEKTAGLPHKLVMTAERKKLVDAKAGKLSAADLAAIIQEMEY